MSYGPTVTSGEHRLGPDSRVRNGTAACGGAGTLRKRHDGSARRNTGTVMAACPSGVEPICTPAADTSPCGFTVCAGPFGASSPRSSPARRRTPSSSGAAPTRAALSSRSPRGSSASGTAPARRRASASPGCSPDGQLASCGINPPTAQLGNGNPAVISGVAAHPDAIGFASDGLARASGSGVTFLGFESVGQTSAVTPTTGSYGTIANGILSAGAVTAQYQGWRPFEYVTLGTPTERPSGSSSSCSTRRTTRRSRRSLPRSASTRSRSVERLAQDQPFPSLRLCVLGSENFLSLCLPHGTVWMRAS